MLRDTIHDPVGQASPFCGYIVLSLNFLNDYVSMLYYILHHIRHYVVGQEADI